MRSEIEIKESIRSIWKDKLQIEEIDLDDDFFKIGGNVIKATGVLKTINNNLNTTLALSDFIENPSISKLVQKISCINNFTSDIPQTETYYDQLEEQLHKKRKIDETNFPNPDEINKSQDAVIQGNIMEAKIIDIFKEILKLEKINLDDNFFEIGGDSIKLMSLILKIQKETNVKINISQFNKISSPREISTYLKGLNNVERTLCIKALEKKEKYKLSNQQKGLFMFQLMNKNSTAYNFVTKYEIKGKLNIKKFENSLFKLIKRHELLRTTYHFDNGGFYQKIHDNIDLSIEYIQETNQNKISELIKNYNKIFDLSVTPPFAVCLITKSSEEHFLIICSHNLIGDWVSFEILVTDFLLLYDNIELVDIRIQYKDYMEWQNKLFSGDIMKSKESYWIEKLSGNLPKTELPIDYSRNGKQVFEAETLEFKFEDNLTEKLNKVAVNNNATLFMLLVTTYNILLSKITNQNDIILGIMGSQRGHEELKKVMGMFGNIIVLRNKIESHYSFVELLEIIKKDVLASFENQDYPFELILYKIKYQRETSRNPLFDTMFNFLSTNTTSKNIHNPKSGLTYKYAVNTEPAITKFDLTVVASNDNNDTRLLVTYGLNLFKASTIKKIFDHYIYINQQVANNPRIIIENIVLDKTTS